MAHFVKVTNINGNVAFVNLNYIVEIAVRKTAEVNCKTVLVYHDNDSISVQETPEEILSQLPQNHSAK